MVLGNSEAYQVKFVPTSVDAQIGGLNSRVSTQNAGGVFSLQYGVALIRNNILDLLSTKRGERVMLPDYGTNMHLALFEPLDEFLVEDIKLDISRAIATYEPRVDILHLEVTEFDESITFSYYTHLEPLPCSGARLAHGETADSKLRVELVVALKDDVTSTESIILAY